MTITKYKLINLHDICINTHIYKRRKCKANFYSSSNIVSIIIHISAQIDNTIIAIHNTNKHVQG